MVDRTKPSLEIGMVDRTKPSLENERYISVRLLERVCKLYGDRGQLLVGGYAYMRWIDDIIDESQASKNDKVDFLDRQTNLVQGKRLDKLHPIEEMFINLPWSSVESKESEIKKQVLILIESIKDDAIHEGLVPRSTREIRHYNYRTLYPCINICNLILNRKDLRPTSKFMELLNDWNNIGSLIDLRDDLEKSQIKVAMSQSEITIIDAKDNHSEKMVQIIKILNKERLTSMLISNTTNVIKNSSSFLDLNMPFWQRIICAAYMITRVPLKSIIKGYSTIYKSSA